jgi:Na+-transporting NADH:ubiquinone oxidoreductase subunit NqrC
MSDNNTSKTEAPDYQLQLGQVQHKLKWLKVILSISVLISLISASSLSYLAIDLRMQVEQNTPADTQNLLVTLAKAEAQLNQNQEINRQHENEMKLLLKQLDEGEGQQDKAQIERIKTVLIQQQYDFQDFLTVLAQGMIELANMVRGTRDWTETYISGIEKAKEQSNQRIAELKAL